MREFCVPATTSTSNKAVCALCESYTAIILCSRRSKLKLIRMIYLRSYYNAGKCISTSITNFTKQTNFVDIIICMVLGH